MSGNAAECLVNPRCSFEAARIVQPSPRPGNVVIIGGGPAGMECARVAALRGHNVTLCNAKPEPGGKLDIVAAPPERESFLLFERYLRIQLKKLNITLVCSTITSPEDIKIYRPDHVVLATGARQTLPPVPGVDKSLVVMAEDVLSGARETGCRVAIIGGGLVGVETAHFLGVREKSVTVLEMAHEIARGCGGTFIAHTHDTLKKFSVTVRTGITVEAVTDEGVRCNGSLLPADTVVIAAGYRSDTTLLEPLRQAFCSVHVIGDAQAPRKIQDATRDGFLCACSL